MAYQLDIDEVPTIVRSWTDNDTAEIHLLSDGSIYTFDEKGAIVLDENGVEIASYWRGDDEPFDIRQLIHQGIPRAHDDEPMTAAMSEASFDVTHHTDQADEYKTGCVKLHELAQPNKETE